MGRKVKVASVQTGPVFMDKKRTVENFASLIEEAGREGAELIVFPETATRAIRIGEGASAIRRLKRQAWRDTVIEYYENSVRIPSVDADLLAKAAASANAICVIGISEADDRAGSKTLYNSMLFLGRNGVLSRM